MNAGFEGAEKIPYADWHGGFFIGDTYYQSKEALEEQLEYLGFNEISDEYAWAAKGKAFCQLDFDNFVDSVYSQAYEDFDAGDIVGQGELKKAINTFNKANEHLLVYSPDYTKAIIL